MKATLEAEVAVVGAGPAGIVLALELAQAGHHVLLIESGGDSYSAATQDLGETIGCDAMHTSMKLATRRQIGGASNIWAGRCVPLDPVDFRARPLVGNICWPLHYDELARRFARTCDWLVCGQPAFDARQVPSLADRQLIPDWPSGDMLSTSLERWSLPTNFRQMYWTRLQNSPLVTLVSNLTCTEIVCTANQRRVDHLVGGTLDGRRIHIRAKQYVLACGGVESTRLLLASNRHHPGGIGNHAGHLGRWYMGHLGASVARIHIDRPVGQIINDYERDPLGVYVRRRFTFSSDYLVAHDLPNGAMWLENPPIGDPSHKNAILSFLYLALASPFGSRFVSEGIRQRKLSGQDPASYRRHIGNVVRELPAATRFALRFAYERYLRSGWKAPGVFVANPANAYPLFYHGEHLPHYDSRIELTDQLDALGMPRVRTRLLFKDEDIRTALRAHEHFDRYLRRWRIGRLEYTHRDPQEAFRLQQLDGYHQMGTTRMSARAGDGVVDAQLAVHGVPNLFVASSSVFVTSGQANSTFMIVAFALRLADHLHSTLRTEMMPRLARPRRGAVHDGREDTGARSTTARRRPL